ncbi:hypothetical protein BBBOND_0312120 [Babesia bigemina]|uniref:Ribosome-binding protein 1 n=1 Tax=Babesia bigemina TaxID=5866 RepID=A0A061DDE2_BABBI|nr:hypothetical protein BBBOND_0312120 [Babesia bigemina]CDR97309.1 hypothetical protein BBBOND_0312120 [Babesia bigemina]|eukprot:XP_012769495.1 hypothetical protein BBBOND_0312120 [Babesia bigemina]
MAKHGVKLDTLKDCFQFLQWLNGPKGQTRNVITEFVQRLSPYYQFNTQLKGQLQVQYTKFLKNVSLLYKALSSNEHITRRTYTVKANDIVESLSEYVPKFLAALYYLQYRVDTEFGKVGGGDWASKSPNSGDFQKFLTTGNDIIGGGFSAGELKNVKGSDLVKVLREILNKYGAKGKPVHDHFRNVMLTTLGKSLDAGNTGNAVFLLPFFCELVLEDSGGTKYKPSMEKGIGPKTICWQDLTSHCVMLKETIDALMRAGFSATGIAFRPKEDVKFVTKAAEWFRENLLSTADVLKRMIPQSIRSQLNELQSFANDKLYPHGFIFDGSKQRVWAKPNKLDEWNPIFQKFLQLDEMLRKLKTILDGYNCGAAPLVTKAEAAKPTATKTEATKTEAAKPASPKAKVTLNQNNVQSGGNASTSSVGKPSSQPSGGTREPGQSVPQGDRGQQGTGGSEFSKPAASPAKQTVQPQQPIQPQPAQPPQATPPPAPASPSQPGSGGGRPNGGGGAGQKAGGSPQPGQSQSPSVQASGPPSLGASGTGGGNGQGKQPGSSVPGPPSGKDPGSKGGGTTVQQSAGSSSTNQYQSPQSPGASGSSSGKVSPSGSGQPGGNGLGSHGGDPKSTQIPSLPSPAPPQPPGVQSSGASSPDAPAPSSGQGLGDQVGSSGTTQQHGRGTSRSSTNVATTTSAGSAPGAGGGGGVGGSNGKGTAGKDQGSGKSHDQKQDEKSPLPACKNGEHPFTKSGEYKCFRKPTTRNLTNTYDNVWEDVNKITQNRTIQKNIQKNKEKQNLPPRIPPTLPTHPTPQIPPNRHTPPSRPAPGPTTQIPSTPQPPSGSPVNQRPQNVPQQRDVGRGATDAVPSEITGTIIKDTDTKKKYDKIGRRVETEQQVRKWNREAEESKVKEQAKTSFAILKANAAEEWKKQLEEGERKKKHDDAAEKMQKTLQQGDIELELKRKEKQRRMDAEREYQKSTEQYKRQLLHGMDVDTKVLNEHPRRPTYPDAARVETEVARRNAREDPMATATPIHPDKQPVDLEGDATPGSKGIPKSTFPPLSSNIGVPMSYPIKPPQTKKSKTTSYEPELTVTNIPDFNMKHRWLPPPPIVAPPTSLPPPAAPHHSALLQHDHTLQTMAAKSRDPNAFVSKAEGTPISAPDVHSSFIPTVYVEPPPPGGLQIALPDRPSPKVDDPEFFIEVAKHTLPENNLDFDLDFDDESTHIRNETPPDPVDPSFPAISFNIPPPGPEQSMPPQNDFDPDIISRPDLKMCTAPWMTQTETGDSPDIPETELFPAEAPRNVREMLTWLAGLRNEKHHGTLRQCINKAFSGLYSDPSQLALFINHAKIRPGDVFDILQLTAMFAGSVLNSIAPNWRASVPSRTVQPKSSDQSYEPDCCALLCQLRDYVYACCHQLQFLKSQCNRGKSHGGWQNCQYGRDLKTPSPLQAFLTDAYDSKFKTHLFDPCNLCLKSRIKMGFKRGDLPNTSQQGSVISTILSPSCGGDDLLLTLSSYLNCITRRTPRTTGELVSFFHHLGNSLHDMYSDTLLPLGTALAKSHADCPDWDHLGRHGLQAVSGIRGSEPLNFISKNNSSHDKDHPRTLSTLVSCGSDPDNCHPRMSPITYRAYAMYSHTFANTYLSWAVYLPDRLWESLQTLHYELNKHDSSKCTSLYLCSTALPLLYTHGFTPPEGTLQLPLKCSDVIVKLQEIVNGGPIATLLTAMDNFLYGIREPFIFTLVALWSTALLVLANTMLYHLDVLHIRSHLIRTKASHLIDVKALLTKGRKMLSLYKDVDYFDEDPIGQLVIR